MSTDNDYQLHNGLDVQYQFKLISTDCVFIWSYVICWHTFIYLHYEYLNLKHDDSTVFWRNGKEWRFNNSG